MTKKDSELIASIFEQQMQLNSAGVGPDRHNDYAVGYLHALEHVSYRMADALALANPRFNRETFLKACGF